MVRTVRTSSGATAVHIVHSSRRGSRGIGHLESMYSSAGVEVPKVVERQHLAAGKTRARLDGLKPVAPRHWLLIKGS